MLRAKPSATSLAMPRALASQKPESPSRSPAAARPLLRRRARRHRRQWRRPFRRQGRVPQGQIRAYSHYHRCYNAGVLGSDSLSTLHSVCVCVCQVASGKTFQEKRNRYGKAAGPPLSQPDDIISRTIRLHLSTPYGTCRRQDCAQDSLVVGGPSTSLRTNGVGAVARSSFGFVLPIAGLRSGFAGDGRSFDFAQDERGWCYGALILRLRPADGRTALRIRWWWVVLRLRSGRTESRVAGTARSSFGFVLLLAGLRSGFAGGGWSFDFAQDERGRNTVSPLGAPARPPRGRAGRTRP